MTGPKDLTDRVRGLIERLAPASVCGHCITDKLELSDAEPPDPAIHILAASASFERRLDRCALCGEHRKVIRRVA